MRNIPIEELISRLGMVSHNALEQFGSLTAEELNLKPFPDSWSIAQCLDHLIVSNEKYFPQIEAIISGKNKNTLYQKLPLLPNLFGKILINAVSPDTERKVKTSKVFYPSSSELPGTIVRNFTAHNILLISLIERTYGLNLEKIIISSPVSSAIIYSLKDTFTILTLHEERHLNQAKRVKDTMVDIQ